MVVLVACGGAEPLPVVAPPPVTPSEGVPPAPPPVSTANDLHDSGGPIAPDLNVYAIFWGDPAAFPADEKAAVESFLGEVDGTPYLAIIDQYLRGAKARSRFTRSIVDPSTPPAPIPDYGQIRTEVCGQIAKAGLTPDPKGLYLLYLSTGTAGTGFCAYHSSTTCGDVDVLVSLVPNPLHQERCAFAGHLGCNSYSSAAPSAATFTVHELVESMTNPYGSAWTGPGNEVADKCYTDFPSCVPLGVTDWEIQSEWSNAAHACVVK